MKNVNKVLSMLSPGYDIRTIDGERCIYRNYGHYDIEVSGLDNRRREIRGYIFIWDKSNGLKVVKRIEYMNIHTLVNLLNKIDSKGIDKLV